MHDAFEIFDNNRAGVITHAKLRDGFASIGVFPTTDEVEMFFLRHDTDKNS